LFTGEEMFTPTGKLINKVNVQQYIIGDLSILCLMSKEFQSGGKVQAQGNEAIPY
jgi:hypothetical protein